MTNSPIRDVHHVGGLLKRYYGITGDLKLLDSYADLNYLVTEKSGRQFVLKFALSELGSQVIDAQNQVLFHVAGRDPDLPVPRVIRTRDGQDSVALRRGGPEPAVMRLLSFLPGTLWQEVPAQTKPFLETIGAFLGRLDVALADFRHPGAARRLVWDLANAVEVFEKTQAIGEAKGRYAVQYLLTQFDALVLPRWDRLPHQTIHNDGNDYNVLVTENSGQWRVTGLIDFGDMVFSARCAEVAIAAAYALLNKDDPMAAASAVVSGYYLANPLEDEELEVLFHLIRARLAVSVTMSAVRKREAPGNAYLLVSEAPAWRAIELLMAVRPDRAIGFFRKACGLAKVTLAGRSPAALVAARNTLLGPSLSLSYRDPLKMVRGWKQYLIDHCGRAFLDGVNNVCHVGHCHPHVVEKITAQVATLNTNTRYLHDHIVELAHRLTRLFPAPLGVAFFVNSGSEANDLALRLARAYTGGEDVIVLDGAYHGNLSSLIDISPYKYAGPGGRGPGAAVHQVPLPDGFRGPVKGQGPKAGAAYAEFIVEKIAGIEAEAGRLAAFFAESLPGCGGQIVLPEGYLKHAYAAVRRAGGVCIADEVQVGFGRVGHTFWGFELQGVVPDIVTLGKPMGNGHPIAAVVTTPAIAGAFANGMEYFNTFGGNPVSCAAGLAVLDVIEKEGLQAHAAKVGDWLLRECKRLQPQFSLIGEVRGMGLFIGLELVHPSSMQPAAREAKALVNEMRQMGILLSTDGPGNNVIKFKPPLPFSLRNARFLVDTLKAGLERVPGASSN